MPYEAARLNPDFRFVTPGPLFKVGEPDTVLLRIANPCGRLPIAKVRVLRADWVVGPGRVAVVGELLDIDAQLAAGLAMTKQIEIIETEILPPQVLPNI